MIFDKNEKIWSGNVPLSFLVETSESKFLNRSSPNFACKPSPSPEEWHWGPNPALPDYSLRAFREPLADPPLSRLPRVSPDPGRCSRPAFRAAASTIRTRARCRAHQIRGHRSSLRPSSCPGPCLRQAKALSGRLSRLAFQGSPIPIRDPRYKSHCVQSDLSAPHLRIAF